MKNRQTEDVVFGRLLRAHREAKGFSQEELGHEAGLTRNYISLLELGQRSPTLRTVLRLAKCFDLSVLEFLTEFDVQYQTQTDQKNGV